MRADSVGRLAMDLFSTDHLDDTEFSLFAVDGSRPESTSPIRSNTLETSPLPPLSHDPRPGPYSYWLFYLASLLVLRSELAKWRGGGYSRRSE
jgi:hypothetical protein